MKKTPIHDRFWTKVSKTEDGCWNWTGTLLKNGYGQVRMDGHVMYSHRVAWAIANGEIKFGQIILHKCDNKRCVRPEHLVSGSYKDNTQDALHKGRMNREVGHGKVILTQWLAERVRAEYESENCCQRYLAHKFNVARSTISDVVNYRTWVQS